VNEIRETGRNTQGVRVIRLREGEQVVDVEPVAEGEEDEIEESQEPQEN
jgi:DNA gyrase subunit A